MWNCKVCGSVVEDDSWDQCWKCSSSRNMSGAEVRGRKMNLERGLSCLRCEAVMTYAGTRQFRDRGEVGGFLGGISDFFEERETFDVYYCPKCGKVEFYLDGIGDEERGETNL